MQHLGSWWDVVGTELLWFWCLIVGHLRDTISSLNKILRQRKKMNGLS